MDDRIYTERFEYIYSKTFINQLHQLMYLKDLGIYLFI